MKQGMSRKDALRARGAWSGEASILQRKSSGLRAGNQLWRPVWQDLRFAAACYARILASQRPPSWQLL